MKHNLFRACILVGAAALFTACKDNTPVAPKAAPSTPLFGINTPANGGGACMGDDAFAFGKTSGQGSASDLNCTSQDVDIGVAVITSYSFDGINFTNLPTACLTNPTLPECRVQCAPGQTVFAQTQAVVENNAQTRYDFGVWIATDGGNAVTGACDQFNLVTPANDLTANKDFSFGVTDADGSNGNPGDACGDMLQGASARVQIGLRTFSCESGPGTPGLVSVGACIGWLNSTDPGGGRTGVCPVPPGGATGFRYGSTPETKAKCKCGPMVLPIDVQAALTLVKVVTNDNGGTSTVSSFPLTATGPSTISGVSGTTSVTGRSVHPGSYALTEQTVASYTASSWACTGGTQSGANVTLASGSSATCTITNNDNPSHLTLVKTVTNDNGGTATTASFPLTAAGPVTISGTSGSAGVTSALVSAGTYTLSEQTIANYSASAWSCSNGGGGSNQVTLALGSSVTCTINNDDNAAHLTLVKTVTNDNGGTKTTADFPLRAAGPSTISGTSGSGGVTNALVGGGTYTLSETTVANYTASPWSCTNGGGASSQVTVALGSSVTCTINNNDNSSTLTLVKTITNDNGGTATVANFPLTATGPSTITGTSGAGSVSNASVNAGTYTLSETTVANYTAGAWSCSNGGGASSQVTVAFGSSVTCTINNNDNAPKLTLVKTVTNDNGGTKTAADFPLTATGPSTISGASGAGSVSNASVNAGTYTLSEQTAANYTAGPWSCSNGGGASSQVTVAFGSSVTCTINNNDNASTLTLVKTLTNDNGGTATLADFPLTATGPSTISGTSGAGSVTNALVNAGLYTLSEQTAANYTASGWSCSNGGGASSQVTVAFGSSVTCTINNNDNASHLTLVKTVTNDNGGTKTTADFPLRAAGPSTISGTSGAGSVSNASVNAGTYTLSETTVANYTASGWSCSNGGGSSSQVTVAFGSSVTCTINNDDNAPHLTLVKTVTNDNGGTKTTADFPLTASGPVTISGVTGATAVTGRAVSAGSYALTEQTLAGYTASSWSCSGGTQTGTSIALALGGSATCTINNNDNAPALSITKTPDQLGDAGYTVQAPGTAQFTITVTNSNAAGTGTALGVTLTDTLPAGLTWSADNASCSTSGSVTPPNPPGDGLTHQLLSCNVGTLAAGGTFTVHVSASVPSSFVQQPASAAGSPIEIDGDLADGAAAGKDWATLPSTLLNCLSTPKIGCDLDKPTGTTDDSFGQGTKEDTPTPTVVSGSIPNNKSDLQRFYVSTERFVTNDFLYLGWERVQAPNGTTNMDFELNQSSQKSANGVTPVRTAGDILIKYDLSRGGTQPTLGFHRWLISGVPSTVCEASNTVPCWGKGTTILNGALAAINTGSVIDPILAPGQSGSRTLDALTFGEASIDLQTAGIFQTGVCVNFGQAYLKSRSSDSFTSEIKDFIAPIPVSVTNCAPVIVNNTAWVSATNVSGSTSDGGQIKVTTP
jgi:transcription elongation GreA/GreB family factor